MQNDIYLPPLQPHVQYDDFNFIVACHLTGPAVLPGVKQDIV